MKAILPILLAAIPVVSAFTQEASTNAVSTASSGIHGLPASRPVLLASVATVTAPMVFTNGILSQPEVTELKGGGRAVFQFAVGNEGDYLISAMLNALDEGANSYFVNVDAEPVDPKMIWDIEITNAFEERTVNWRGNGTPESDEFTPKTFHLSAGEHKLILIGREPVELKSITIKPKAN